MRPPTSVELLSSGLNQADQCGRAGRLDDMERVCGNLLTDFPNSPEVLNRLAIVSFERGNGLRALAYLEKAISFAPNEPSYQSNLGELQRRSGVVDKAIAHCRRAVELGPNYLPGRLNLAFALLDIGSADEAREQFHLVTLQDPSNASAWGGLGRAYAMSQLFEQALAAWNRCLELSPSSPYALAMRAHTKLAGGDVIGAVSDAQRAVDLDATSSQATEVLADSLAAVGRTTDAEVLLRKALHTIPGHAGLEYRLGLSLLALANYGEGFERYEARLNLVSTNNPIRRPILPMPEWAGESLSGRRLLVLTEQGYGDHIQFCRFVSIVAATGAEVVLGVSPVMKDLMSTLPGARHVSTTLEEALRFGCDYWTFIGSLPHRLGISVESLVPESPYLTPNSFKRAHWRQMLARFPETYRIGLVWAGRPEHENDRNRSIPFERLAPLSDVPNASWISLQLGRPTSETEASKSVFPVKQFLDASHTFDDTAALIAELDLLITVDTASAHLAGALGRPVWLLLPQVADWRWALADGTSPWYPSMRIFRQRSKGGWDHVIEALMAALRAELKDSS
jgi:tetratricopeptide (TPR) repeat protein